MAEKLIVHYDKEGDVLDISVGKPRKALSRELEENVFVRIDPESKKVVGFMILGFEKLRKQRVLPISAEFQIS